MWHEDLEITDLSGFGIRDLHGLAGIVDEELFSGPIFLAKTGIELLSPLVIEATKLTILVPSGFPCLYSSHRSWSVTPSS